jgi:hypothetical protein
MTFYPFDPKILRRVLGRSWKGDLGEGRGEHKSPAQTD